MSTCPLPGGRDTWRRPQRENLGALVPRSAAGPRLFGTPGQTAGVDALPLPAEQAFNFEAIVGDGNSLLLRFTPAPGYYIYRDRTSLALEGTGGVRTGCRAGRRARRTVTNISAMWWCISTRPK